MVEVKPIIGITMGDPAGIGPEIIAKALSLEKIHRICKPIVIGDSFIIDQGVKIANAPLSINSVASVSHARFVHDTIDVLDLSNVDPQKLLMGQAQAMCGKASVEYIEKAVELASRGAIHAITTAPISKEAIHMAGCKFKGHTEILAHLTNTRDYAMMLVTGSLRVIHVTTHVPLRRVHDLIKKDRITLTIKLAFKALRDLGFENPRIAVAGLNPHAGENGLLGKEELNEIGPAIESVKQEGLAVTGPLPPDTVFVRAKGGEFDAVVVMYHDQGHIPVKLLSFAFDQKKKKWKKVGGVNVTLGLPIIRTSVDHGTAYGKAGKKEGTANPQSLIEAIKLAAKMATEKPKS